jgi:ClpP class serine protease
VDIKTGLAIYNQPWLIEPQAGLRMLDYWEKVVSGGEAWDFTRVRAFEKDDSSDSKAISPFQFKQQHMGSAEVVLSPTSRYDLKEFKGFEGARIAMIPVTGPLMKSDFCGDFGTQSLKTMVQLASQAKSVETIVFVMDTPGGTVDGTEVFAKAIKESAKRTVALVSGQCCSAGYWVASSADELYATAETDIIGSIGTMMSWMDYSKAMEERGIVERQVYATRSKDKNGAFNEAKSGNDKLLISEFLDPMNNVFLKTVQENRMGKIDLKKEDVLTGKTYIGVANIENGLIDGIMSVESLMDKLLTSKSNNNSKTYAMSKPILAFGAVLLAAKAEEFPVVEGGFLLTEEQLNNIDAKLDQDQVTASTTAVALKALQSQEESFKGSAKTAADLLSAQGEITQLKADLKTAQDTIAAYGKKPGAEFASTTAEQDPAPDANDYSAALDKLPHNQKADSLIPKVPAKA